MSLPSLRDMPIVEATGPRADGSFVVALPGRVYSVAPDREAALRLVQREAPGSATRFSPVPTSAPDFAAGQTAPSGDKGRRRHRRAGISEASPVAAGALGDASLTLGMA